MKLTQQINSTTDLIWISQGFSLSSFILWIFIMLITLSDKTVPPPQNNLHVATLQPHPPHNPNPSTTDLFSITTSLSFQECYRNESCNTEHFFTQHDIPVIHPSFWELFIKSWFFLILNSIPLDGCITVYLFTYWRTFGLCSGFIYCKETCCEHS